MNEIEEYISSYISKNILFSSKGYPYLFESSFLENGVIDSMNILELVMLVEEKYGFVVPDSDITPENFDSIARLARYINSKQ